MGSKYPTARMVEPAVESTFSTWNSGGYCQYLRGIPKYPRMNCGKNVRLKPMNTSSAANLPDAAGYMRPDQKSEDCNRNTRHRHEVVTEDAFAGETRDHFALYRHRRQDHDVDRGVRVKPEQMLKQQRIAAAVRIKNPQIEGAFKHHQQQ